MVGRRPDFRALWIIAVLLGLAEIWTAALSPELSCSWWAQPNDYLDVLNQALTSVTVLVYGAPRTRPGWVCGFETAPQGRMLDVGVRSEVECRPFPGTRPSSS